MISVQDCWIHYFGLEERENITVVRKQSNKEEWTRDKIYPSTTCLQ
jgi:cupin superfamily acireductone dioxygenase involved in methionine salvage